MDSWFVWFEVVVWMLKRGKTTRRAQIEARASLALLLTLIFSALLQRHSTNSDCHLLVLRNLQLDLPNLSSVLDIPDETGVL